MRKDITDDSYAIILLCSDLSTKSKSGSHKPLTVSEWAVVAESLITNKLSPKAFFSDDIDNLITVLKLDENLSLRIKNLMQRAALVSLEINSLFEKGIFILTRADSEYPSKYKTKLGRLCPPVLFCAGNIDLLKKQGIVVVGSRTLTPIGEDFARKISEKCVKENLVVISGGAKGADSISESTASKHKGAYISVISDSLVKRVQQKEVRESIMNNRALIISPMSPTSHFSVANAMQRNKYVYSLGELAIVVSSTSNKGGSWNGAVENYRNKFTPMRVFIREGEENGNDSLVRKFGIPIISDAIFSEDVSLLSLKNINLAQISKVDQKSEKSKKSVKKNKKSKEKTHDTDEIQLKFDLASDDN